MKARFSLGQTVATPGALAVLQASAQSPSHFLTRHLSGDWGDLGNDDKQANDEALLDGSRIFSAYKTSKGKTLWVITEADRTSTCILLPDEY